MLRRPSVLSSAWLRPLLLSLAAVGFAAVFCTHLSPLYPAFYSLDAEYFLIAGRQILQGGVPYLDFFDIKGPVIYFLYALGMLIQNGRTGVFVLECAALAASVWLLDATARLWVPPRKANWMLLGCALILTVTMQGGGRTEDFNLPFILLALYFFCRELKKPELTFPPRLCLLYGLCFGIVFHTRPTNAAVFAGIALYTLVALLAKKQFALLWKNIGYFLLGFLLVTAPFVIYFAANGALREFLRGSLLLPYLYGATGSAGRGLGKWLTVALSLTPAAAGLFLGLGSRKHENRLGWPLAAASAAVIVCFLPGLAWSHYYMMTIPVFLLAMVQIEQTVLPPHKCSVSSLWRALVSLSLIGMALFYFSDCNANLRGLPGAFSRRGENAAYTEQVRRQADLIPAEERDSVWGYGYLSSWFAINEITPCFRIMSTSWYFRELDPEISAELDTFVLEVPPKWVLKKEGDKHPYPLLDELLASSYQLILREGNIRLYQKISNP
ncbi:MAG: glycosyltransferase family 39 protein [Oscillospiraceae bacterium]|jgi:hypothetical protein|nr:glycosyltransferase family 39 protein [Oscillospiraceae bacterium]